MPERPSIGRIAERLLHPDSPEFFADFWRSVERRDADAARRWRRAALALAALLVTATTAAAVIAAPFGHSNTADATVECLTQTLGSRRSVDISTVATRSAVGAARSGRPRESQLLVSTGGAADQGTRLLQIDGVLKGYLVNGSRCAASHDTGRPLRRGLRLTDYLRAGSMFGHVYRCYEQRIRLRVHVTFGKDGLPARAQLAVERARSSAPLLYVDWRPSLVQVFESDACDTTDIGF